MERAVQRQKVLLDHLRPLAGPETTLTVSALVLFVQLML
jgi:hypothetical protein